MKTMNVVGCGKVGQTLARLVHTKGACDILDLKGNDPRNTERAAAFIGAGRVVADVREMRPADVWLLAVPDTRIAEVAQEIATSLRASPGASPVAMHCSGFLPASSMEPLRALGFRLASAHPVLSFADPATAVAQFEGTPCGMEGDPSAIEEAQVLLASIGAQCFAVRTELKPLYHAAAVFSNNFNVVLQSIAREAWAAAGVPDDIALKIHRSLLEATTANVLSLGPRAITGPAARGDEQVLKSQAVEVFKWNPDAGLVYQQLTRLARRLARHQTTLPVKSAGCE
jgi:predicted short-subunit dehydrogenase-like oxidoreductase (DUF2520 family)